MSANPAGTLHHPGQVDQACRCEDLASRLVKVRSSAHAEATVMELRTTSGLPLPALYAERGQETNESRR
ncbi:hypothetical protein F0L17_00295 [Streptomyces sp. TRM43335]|uniref:DUF6299 domain-containing protein n=1 Tax=Streptomyces taklimakanensis TaxID=2569853 RepID=A0A6G2B6R7_9ACTN|nr:DUF6299 family protein [Streptomyces taklimakanensis]MTE17602.1 hypothetical protein [Streptomyces taklimakanensis]